MGPASESARSHYLAFFDKCSLTFWTADFNLAFTLWYAYLLFAGRAFVNVMSLPLCHQILLFIPEIPDTRCMLQKGLIFS